MSEFLVGGRMGDLIHVLWVARNTPGQHDFFITDRRDLHSDGFQLPLWQTVDELTPILELQPWFRSLSVYNNQHEFGETLRNLSMWRRYVYSASWLPLLAKTFGREINTEPWIVLPKIIGWRDRIVFHCSVHAARKGHWNITIDQFNDERAVFVGGEEEFRLFGYKMEYYKPKNLFEHFSIINSCKYFIGNQSMPLAAAHAMDVPRLAILNSVDEVAYLGEEKYYNNFSFISDSNFFFEAINW